MKIVVYTLGCKVNQYESDGLVYALKNLGHDVSTEIEPADVYILNTCAVTNEAEKKSRQTISKFKALNNDAKILVCGCASQKDFKQFADINNVTFIKGTANKIDLIQNLQNTGTKIDDLPTEYSEEFVSIPTKTRAHIKIQDGCNNFCSYCIIPYLRGRSRSRELNDIMQEIDRLSKDVKEIVITGIDITDYKINGKRAITTLIEKLAPYKNVRFRLGSLEQGIIDEKFVLAVKNANICPHFHLSLQSGCDETLKRMNRKYTAEQYFKSVEYIYQHIPNACITTDVIVGFPGETDAEFKRTCDFVKKCSFYNIHIFPYSVRSGTVASKMPQVYGGIKKERAKILADINKQLNKNYLNKCKGKTLTVLVEEFDGEYYIGHTENYIKCYIKEQCKLNDFVKVKIIEQYKDGAIAQKENNMDNCIFCKINNGEIPSPKVYEDEDFFIINDINPKAKKHYLMIPKHHYAYISEQTNDDVLVLGKMLSKLPVLAKELGIENGYRAIINQGSDGGQEVAHLHVHVLGGEKLKGF